MRQLIADAFDIRYAGSYTEVIQIYNVFIIISYLYIAHVRCELEQNEATTDNNGCVLAHAATYITIHTEAESTKIIGIPFI